MCSIDFLRFAFATLKELANNIFAYNIKMAGLSAWNKAVKQAFKSGRRTNKNFSLKEAMFAAKKIYKKGKDATVDVVMNRKSSRKTKKNISRKVRGGAPTQPPVVATVGDAQTVSPSQSSSNSALKFSEVAAK